MSLARLLGARRRDRILAYASTLFRETPERKLEHRQRRRLCGGTHRRLPRGEILAGAVFRRRSQGRDLTNSSPPPARHSGPDRHLLEGRSQLVSHRLENHRSQMRSRREAVAMCEWLPPTTISGWVEDFAVHPGVPAEYALRARAKAWCRSPAGEQVATIWDFERFIGEGCVDAGNQPDLSRCGGISVAAKVAAMAEEADIDLQSSHSLAHASANRLQPATGRNVAARLLRRVQRQPERLDPLIAQSKLSNYPKTAHCRYRIRRGLASRSDLYQLGTQGELDHGTSRRPGPQNSISESPGRRDYYAALEHDSDLGRSLIPLPSSSAAKLSPGQGFGVIRVRRPRATNTKAQ